MTDVAGPPEPFARFSSLPIRGRNETPTATAAGASGLKFGRDMAQALDFPMRPDGGPGTLTRSHRGFSSFRSPFPAGPSGTMGWKYGSHPGAAQAPDKPLARHPRADS